MDKICLILLIILFIAVFVVFFYLFVMIKKLKQTQDQLISLFNGSDVVEDVIKVTSDRRKLQEEMSKVASEVDNIREKQSSCFDRVNIVRYCMPGQSEARMSYSVGLTNGQDDALVITGLSYRNGVNMYFKRVKDGESDFPLSEEEKRAISRNKLSEICDLE